MSNVLTAPPEGHTASERNSREERRKRQDAKIPLPVHIQLLDQSGQGGYKDAGYHSKRPLLHQFKRLLRSWDALVSDVPQLRRSVPERSSACRSSPKWQPHRSRAIRFEL